MSLKNTYYNIKVSQSVTVPLDKYYLHDSIIRLIYFQYLISKITKKYIRLTKIKTVFIINLIKLIN